MFWTNTKRVLRSGFVNFWRNRVVSLASVLIMTVTLFVIGTTLFLGALLQSSLDQLRDKVDINIYFTTDAPEEQILALQDSLENLPEVAATEYTSREQALANFRERHAGDELTIQALDELGENPLGASVGVRANETDQYESIANFLADQTALTEGEDAIIDNVNFEQNKVAIQRLDQIIEGAQTIGVAAIAFLIVVSIVITFNTIRLAIYTAREEITVMRLVGANNRYIRGPFVVEGVMYGLASGLIALGLFYPVTLWLGNATERFFGGINLFEYYVNNFAEIFLLVVGAGILLGIVSSYLAVRRYLKV